MFDFVSLLEKTRERVIYMKRQAAEDSELEGLRTSFQSLDVSGLIHCPYPSNIYPAGGNKLSLDGGRYSSGKPTGLRRLNINICIF